MDTQKETIRFEAKRHRDRINPLDEMEDPALAVDLFFEKIAPDPSCVVGAYWPKGREFDARYFLERLLQDGFTCALPVIEKDSRILKFARWDDKTELVDGAFGVKEPASKDFITPHVLLVPLLAFDQKGGRIGYGGGYYDATLSYLREKGDVLAVGVGYAQQAVIFKLPQDEHDQLLDWVITPQRAYDHTEQD